MAGGPSHRIGTLPWARETGGRLGFRDRLRFLGEAARAKIKLRLRKENPTAFHADLDRLRIPDSAPCQAAMALTEALSSEALAAHCFRTYLWGAAIAQGEKLSFDEELLFIACALHDLGLTEKVREIGGAPAPCFAVEGAFAAERFLDENDMLDPARQEQIAEAITLHLNVEVPKEKGIEAHLLHEGAALDVIGSRYREIKAETRKHVLTLYPRRGVKKELISGLRGAARPKTRTAMLCKYGFLGMVRKTPFES